jgi:hypothetical protein
MFIELNNASFYVYRFINAGFHVFFLNTMLLEHSDLNMSKACCK